jgi:hypothetical protein
MIIKKGKVTGVTNLKIDRKANLTASANFPDFHKLPFKSQSNRLLENGNGRRGGWNILFGKYVESITLIHANGDTMLMILSLTLPCGI